MGMTYPQILYYLESLEREIFDHTMLLRYCAILLKEIGMNFLGMNYPIDTLPDIYLRTADFGEIVLSSLTTFQTEFRNK